MPAFRFIGYFLALAACSTLAFASLAPDNETPQDASASAPYSLVLPPASLVLPSASLLSLPDSPVHRHKAVRRHFLPAPAQVAQADQAAAQEITWGFNAR